MPWEIGNSEHEVSVLNRGNALVNEHEDIEIKLLLEGIYLLYGYDFRDYAMSSLKRRIRYVLDKENLRTVSELQNKLLHDKTSMERFIQMVSVSVTSMFRDPGFFAAFREKVVPALSGLPFIRIWHAGCGSGDEVFSMAILLKEEGLLSKTRIYATDMNEKALRDAKNGIVLLDKMKENMKDYLLARGTESFSEYYATDDKYAILNRDLRENVVWALHNLVTDHSFNEFHVILCRNVMIYFNQSLLERVHRLLYDSLAVSGYLGIGNAESLRSTANDHCYEQLAPGVSIYRKER